MNSTLVSGILAGIVGLLVFLFIHHLWIVPIWFILPIGLVIASGGGAAVGWAYGQLLPHLPPRPWTVLVIFALIWTVLLPGLVWAELRQPLFDITGSEAVLATTIGRATLAFIVELLVTATLTGAIAGWLIAGSARAALAMAVAAFVFALGPGHNIPFIGGTPGVGKELAIIAAIIAASTLVLVEGNALLKRGVVAR